MALKCWWGPGRSLDIGDKGGLGAPRPLSRTPRSRSAPPGNYPVRQTHQNPQDPLLCLLPPARSSFSLSLPSSSLLLTSRVYIHIYFFVFRLVWTLQPRQKLIMRWLSARWAHLPSPLQVINRTERCSGTHLGENDCNKSVPNECSADRLID